MAHLGRQLEPGGEARRRREERARLGQRAERAVEVAEQPARRSAAPALRAAAAAARPRWLTPMLRKNSTSSPVTSTGSASNASPSPRASHSAARGVGAVAQRGRESPARPVPRRGVRCKAPRPPCRRRLPCTSSSSSCGGSSETLGVNWQAQAAIGSSASGGRQGKWRASQSMDRSFHGEAQRRGGRHPAALEDVHRKRLPSARRRRPRGRGAGRRARIRRRLRAGETARPRRRFPRPRPPGAAGRRSSRGGTSRAARGSCRRAGPAPPPTAHRAGPGRAPRRAAPG